MAQTLCLSPPKTKNRAKIQEKQDQKAVFISLSIHTNFKKWRTWRTYQKKKKNLKTHRTVTQTFPQLLFFFSLHKNKWFQTQHHSPANPYSLSISWGFLADPFHIPPEFPQTQFKLAGFVPILRATPTLTHWILAMEPSLRIWAILKWDLGNLGFDHFLVSAVSNGGLGGYGGSGGRGEGSGGGGGGGGGDGGAGNSLCC